MPPTPHEPIVAPGATIDRYMVVSELGRGGMGVVLKAYDPQLERPVALKLVNLSRGVSDEARSRLLREARAIALLSHPNIVTVYDAGRYEDQVFIAMELVHGNSLRERFENQRPTTRECVDLFLQVARGLEAAHKKRIVHRDIKPDNILVDDEDGRVRIADFGIARASAGWDAPEPSTDTPPRVVETITMTGALIGTPAYMAPEQQRGHQADERSDQFSFFVTFYEALTGTRPFGGETRDAKADTNTASSGHFQTDSDVPKWLQSIISRGLSKDSDERFASMSEVVRELTRDRGALRRRLVIGGAFAALLALALIAFLTRGQDTAATSTDPCENVEAPIRSLWSDDNRARLKTAFTKTNAAHALTTFELVSARLQRYADQLSLARRRTCEATNVARSQSASRMDRKMQCIGRRTDELRAYLDVFSAADPPVDRAVRTAAALTPIAQCSERRVIDAIVPWPSDATKREAVRGMQQSTTRVRTLLNAGEYKTGLDLSRRLKTEAEKIGYLPIRAETEYLVARMLQKNGEAKAAERMYMTAARTASAAGVDHLVARSYLALMRTLGDDRRKWQRAILVAPFVEAAIERAHGDDGRLRIMLDMTHGSVFIRAGDIKAARKMFERALASVTKYEGADSLNASRALANLATALSRLGHLGKALEHSERSLAIKRKQLGPEHPSVFVTMYNVATVLARTGQHKRASELLKPAIERLSKRLGMNHPVVMGAMNALAVSLQKLGKLTAAHDLLTRLLAATKTVQGPLHPRTALMLNNLGNVAIERNKLDEALRYHTEAATLRRKVLPATHPDVAMSESNLGTVLARQGKCGKALPHYLRALGIWSKSLGKEHRYVATAASGIGGCYMMERKPDRAIVYYERAARIHSTLQRHPADHAGVLFELARAMVAHKGSSPQALSYARTARDLFGKLKATAAVAKINRWLAAQTKR